MSTKKSGNWVGAIRSMERAVQLLPSDEEIKHNVQAIDSLISFLQELREMIVAQPTEEIRNDVLKAITVLSSFLSSNSAKLLLGSKSPVAKSKMNSETAANLLFEQLHSLTLDEIQARLLDPHLYSVKDLKSLAKHLRIGIDRNFRREDIADSIFKRGFANPRGYQAIGGAAARKIQEEKDRPEQP
jgi:hypothetical protein